MRVFKVTTLVTLMMMSGCFGHSHTEDNEPVKRIDANTVGLSDDAMKNIEMAQAKNGNFPERLSLMGRISIPEDQQAVVPARIAGRVDAVYVTSGERVQKGQVLASLFSPDFVIAREEYLQALKQSQAPSDSSEGRHLLQMAVKKLENMGMSEVDITKLSGPTDPDKSHLIIRAPMSGILLQKNAVIGNLNNVGDTLFMLGNISKVWFAGDIYPEDVTKIHKNQEVMIEPMDGGKPVHGKVNFISPVVDPTSRTIKVRALVENPGDSLKADMYVRGYITLKNREALLIPKDAIIRLGAGIFCFKKVGQNDFRKVSVQISGEESDGIAVSGGLQDGDTVVSQGGLLLDAALANP